MKAKRKLNNRKGFTLAETLLAVLILLMVSAIVANGIPVAKNVYEKVTLGANAQLLLSTSVTLLRDELGTARDVTVNGNMVTYCDERGVKARISNGGTKGSILLERYIDFATPAPMAGATASPEPRLVSAKASTGDLYVTYKGVAPVTGTDIIRFSGLRVSRESDTGNTALASLETLDIRIVTGPAVTPSPAP